MSIKRERAVWLVVAVILTASAVTITNHMRDFNEYRDQASKAQGTISALQSHSEDLQAQIAKQEQTITALKAVPLR